MSSLETKSIKQKVINNVTQPLYIGGIQPNHSDSRMIIDVNGNILFQAQSITVPVGNTSQRPSTPTAGMLRYNSDELSFEGYSDGEWGAIGGGGSGQMLGEADIKAIAYNSLTISENIVIPAGVGAYSAGDVEIMSGYEVEITAGSEWVII